MAFGPPLAGRLDSIQAEDEGEIFEHAFKPPALPYSRRFYADMAIFGAPHAVRCAGNARRRLGSPSPR